jgi:hypothetical protein
MVTSERFEGMTTARTLIITAFVRAQDANVTPEGLFANKK